MFNRRISLMSGLGAIMALASAAIRPRLPQPAKATERTPKFDARGYRPDYKIRPRHGVDEQRAAFQSLVNAMTGHERNQWARKGHPGLQGSDVGKLKAAMPALHATLERRRSGHILSLSGAA